MAATSRSHEDPAHEDQMIRSLREADQAVSVKLSSRGRPVRAMILVSALLAATGCAPEPTSSCGVGITESRCREFRTAFSRSMGLACDGPDLSLQFQDENASSPDTLETMRYLCQMASREGRDAPAYHYLAVRKCALYEEILPDSIGAMSRIPSIVAPLSKETFIEHDEQILANCKDFRGREMTGRDFLYEEAKLYRSVDPVDVAIDEIKQLTSSLAGAVLAILGAVATLVGIAVGVKSFFASK
ncbi:MAG: hypothetical protein V2J24_05700 [Pseudomonadales bacterium]|jgi:hypothetical protein|nr:hypothetical protein [Pseudomonadales bacterium]